MRKISFILICLLSTIIIISGCSYHEKTISIPEDLKAVYLINQKDTQLSREELKSYPQVIVVNNFDDMKTALDRVNKKVGIWIDKSAIETADKEWLLQEPQKSYPVLLIGFYDVMNPKPMREAFYTERIDWNNDTLSEGFSFWIPNRFDDPSSDAEYIEGIDVLLTIDEMLRVIDELMK